MRGASTICFLKSIIQVKSNIYCIETHGNFCGILLYPGTAWKIFKLSQICTVLRRMGNFCGVLLYDATSTVKSKEITIYHYLIMCASADCSWAGKGGEGLLVLGQVLTVYLCIMCGSNSLKGHIVVFLCRVMCRTVHCVSGSIKPYFTLFTITLF